MSQKALSAASRPCSLSKDRGIEKAIWADSMEAAELRGSSRRLMGLDARGAPRRWVHWREPMMLSLGGSPLQGAPLVSGRCSAGTQRLLTASACRPSEVILSSALLSPLMRLLKNSCATRVACMWCAWNAAGDRDIRGCRSRRSVRQRVFQQALVRYPAPGLCSGWLGRPSAPGCRTSSSSSLRKRVRR